MTTVGRVDRWQHKLLDLSLRNRLLNFRPTKGTIPIICPNISLLRDRLAGGARIPLISLSDRYRRVSRDIALHHQGAQQDLDKTLAGQALEKGELACQLSEPELTSRLTTLYRKMRSDLVEGGSNTLYLAVGFLRWKLKPTDHRAYWAPLLLVPVTLVRRNASSTYYLTSHEDDACFNATLVQLLKKDFDCDLTTLDSCLPSGDSGVDVTRLLDIVRHAVRDVQGFEVVEETAIATFSFAKYLMWKDLVARTEQLEQNRVVRHLIQSPDQPFSSAVSAPLPRPHEIDTRFTPDRMVHPLAADSSQLAAVMAASEGHDLVVVGPPGTGKSQTIANTIAQCLAVGKRVLFVAEKTAALDVVHRRLREIGLGNCCVALHSNKAERRRFLDQLSASWANRAAEEPTDWDVVTDRLRLRRDQLNDYVAAVHTPGNNGWTPYLAMGECVRGRDRWAPVLDWPTATRHDLETYDQLSSTVNNLAIAYTAVPNGIELPRLNVTGWSMTWENQLLTACRELNQSVETLTGVTQQFASELDLTNAIDISAVQLAQLNRLAQLVISTARVDASMFCDSQFDHCHQTLMKVRKLQQRHEAIQSRINANYPAATLERIPVDKIDRRWRDACASVWPLSWYRQRKVARLMQTYATTGQANPATDLAAIRERCAIQTALRDELASLQPYWNGKVTDLESLESTLKLLREIRDAFVKVGQAYGGVDEIVRTLSPVLKDASGSHPFIKTAELLQQAIEVFTAAWRRYIEVANATPADNASPSVLRDASYHATHILANRSTLPDWIAWIKARHQAKS
ncbi:MAG: DUF4011 domain-containing protein, partial [Planctomycetales bacterium]|nr:DUF4011 domain-containing protein [Planctomycetales bacterium]